MVLAMRSALAGDVLIFGCLDMVNPLGQVELA